MWPYFYLFYQVLSVHGLLHGVCHKHCLECCGLQWLLTNLTGNHVYVCGHGILQVSAIFQTVIVCTNFFLLVGLALIRKKNKARLQKWKAGTLIVLYFMVMLG